MTTQLDNDALPSPIELMDSARQKYTLAQARIRRGPPELALLSLHGSLEDALRARAIHRRLPAAAAPFPQLIDALAADADAPLSTAEAESVRKMHRLRARVAHGEQITVAAETIEAYQRLIVRLLSRYGVLVVGPEDEPPPRAERATTTRLERGATRPIAGAGARWAADSEGAGARGQRRRSTSSFPILDRYPDLAPGRESGPRSRWATYEAERAASFFERSQTWLVPLLIIVTIFLIGATISIALQQMGTPSALPTAPVVTSFAPEITTAPISGASVNEPEPPTATAEATSSPLTPTPSDGLAPGVTAYVRLEISGANLRALAGTNQQIVLGLAPGTQVQVIDGPVEADGLQWWRVRIADIEGWCAADLLEVR